MSWIGRSLGFRLGGKAQRLLSLHVALAEGASLFRPTTLQSCVEGEIRDRLVREVFYDDAHRP